MDGDRTARAMARIEAALARIEAGAQQAGGASGSMELARLEDRHARLRAAVQDSLTELDQLIEGAQG
ncbi:MAG: hypothetical protein KGM49_11045 [Sphingomonadales bacterium]|nr:hypothetical protein [Sphingomonadales bacterium]